jgi:hypothetical protein
VEIVTGPVPAQSPFIPLDAKIVVGAVAPASPDPIPIVLLPGFEYRMLEWRNPKTHEIHWRLERRKSTRAGEDDDQHPAVKPADEESLGVLRLAAAGQQARPSTRLSGMPSRTPELGGR